MHRRTKQEYADLAAFCRVNERMAPDDYSLFIPDLYKTGWIACNHQSDVSAERTREKIETRRQEALRLGVGSDVLKQDEVAIVVTDLMCGRGVLGKVLQKLSTV
jgi:hypothetical protein